MQHRSFGRTGVKVSALGFGCMRLPMKGDRVDRDLATPMIRRAVQLGINFFDTCKRYCQNDSEPALGEAIQGLDRGKLYISTKYAAGTPPSGPDLREKFETSLRTMGLEYIDFYHFWGISWERFQQLSVKGGALEACLKLRDQKLIRHFSFSFHAKPEELIRLVDTGHFESVLCQYNLLDRSNEQGIAHAAARGLGVAVMGPVAGGRLGAPSEVIGGLLGKSSRVSTPELALRFVLSNPNVSVALSGMSAMAHVEENAATASRTEYLTAEERRRVERAMDENRKLANLYCTGCKYCLPCPQEVNIPRVFELMNYYRVYGLVELARQGYRDLDGGKGKPKGKSAAACIECGQCEDKCPQKIKIVQQLAEAHQALAR